MTLNIGCRPMPLRAALALTMVIALQSPLFAQGLKSEEAIDAIVGSEVKTEEVEPETASKRITTQNAERVRKTFSLEELDIVLLPDLDRKGQDIAKAIAEHEKEIAILREAIEGSALFFHAVDSRSIQVRDVVALDYGEDGTVTIFVKGGVNEN